VIDFNDEDRTFERSHEARPGETASSSADDFAKAFGEDLRQVLGVQTWRVGNDLVQEYERVAS
jgi:hypothetical protein